MHGCDGGCDQDPPRGAHRFHGNSAHAGAFRPIHAHWSIRERAPRIGRSCAGQRLGSAPSDQRGDAQLGCTRAWSPSCTGSSGRRLCERGTMRDVPTSTEQTSTPAAPGSPGPTPETQTRALPQADETSRRRRALHQELAVRAGIALLMLVSNELLTMMATAQGVIRVAALLGLFVNGPYYLAARSGRWRRLQAWVRMAMDVGLITAGLYAAGGPPPPPYLRGYPIVPGVTGLVVSRLPRPLLTPPPALALPTPGRPAGVGP